MFVYMCRYNWAVVTYLGQCVYDCAHCAGRIYFMAVCQKQNYQLL